MNHRSETLQSAVIPWLLLQKLPMLFNGPDNPQTCPFLRRISTPYTTWLLGPTRVSPPKRHLDQLSRFWTAHEHDQQRQTNRPTALHCCDVTQKLVNCSSRAFYRYTRSSHLYSNDRPRRRSEPRMRLNQHLSQTLYRVAQKKNTALQKGVTILLPVTMPN